MTKQLNLLTDKLLITQLIENKNAHMTLPEVLACLHNKQQEVIGFRHLQPYQAHAWYAFLTQLCAIARHLHPDASQEDLESADRWTLMLRSLTNNATNDSSWLLLNERLDEAAFMQPALPEKDLNGFEPENSPDLIDVLFLAKNHDVKKSKIHSPHPSHWIFALISMQTMGGFSGRDNYGISRMNKSFGNRSCITHVKNPFSWGQRLREDVTALIKWREKLCEVFSYPDSQGIALLWLEPWDGNISLHLHQLDPFYIEICRRLRLTIHQEKIVCLKKPSKKRRIDAENYLGNVGDPWLIIDTGDKSEPSTDSQGHKAITVMGSGFSYQLSQKLLFDPSYKWSPIQKNNSFKKTGGWCLMHTLVRGQGETEGYHERIIPVPAEYYDPLESSKHEDLAKLSHEMVKMAGEYQNILRKGLLAFFQGVGDLKKIDYKDKRPIPWLDVFNKEIDQRYFHHLWKATDNTIEEVLNVWGELLENKVNDQFESVVQSFFKESPRYFKNRAEADRLISKLLFKQKNT